MASSEGLPGLATVRSIEVMAALAIGASLLGSATGGAIP